MKRVFAILLALLLLLSPAALAEAEPDNPAAGNWYATADGVPITLSLNPGGSYTLALPAAMGASSSGKWTLDDGFVRLNNGSTLNLVNESLLVWTENALFFSREPAQTYAPAELLPDAPLDLYAGYWRCVYVNLGDAIVPAEAVDETTDLHIDGTTVALGGPRFGDVFRNFIFGNGALSTTFDSQSLTLALQQDAYLRLTLGGTTLYLAPAA